MTACWDCTAPVGQPRYSDSELPEAGITFVRPEDTAVPADLAPAEPRKRGEC